MTIEIMLIGGMWCARFNGDGAAEIVDLFGTDTLPTPYTGLTSAAEVALQVGRRNPGAGVVVL